MAGQIFAYITHKAGKADDSALELATAAGKIYPDASTTAIVTGAGADLDERGPLYYQRQAPSSGFPHWLAGAHKPEFKCSCRT